MSRSKGTGKPKDTQAGSKERVLADIGRYLENPDAPMVSHGVANNSLTSTNNMNISPSKMYEDGGHKMAVVRALADRAAHTICPNTPEGMFLAIEDFLTFCADNSVPPTIGGFAIWNGITIVRFDQIARNKNNAELAHAASVCKEIIRNFLEIAAMDSSLNPIVYFHQNKVYYGAVENQQVTLRVEDNSKELSEEDFSERAGLLVEMVQREDGSWAMPET